MKLIHQTPSFCVCVRWLVRHANNTPEIVTALNRKVEDALQKADTWLSDVPATLLFDPGESAQERPATIGGALQCGGVQAVRRWQLVDEHNGGEGPPGHGHLDPALPHVPASKQGPWVH